MARGDADKIKVTGIRELARELRRIDAAFTKELRAASLDVAREVAEGTKTRLSALGGSGPMAASTVKALATQRRAQVKGGGGNTRAGRVFAGNNFGSVRYEQFPPRREPDHGIYASLRDMRDGLTDRYADAVDRIVSRAFPD